jgi:hypothetical protein
VSLDDWGMGRRPSWIKVVALVMALLLVLPLAIGTVQLFTN